ncbi:MAG: (d)CMP kinase [Erysipelotrichaceae bacterium]|nr:(d)CMP kinase [Erysipelotrichaceae bacterium]
MKLNIAIDGPSGAGKSTISDILAERLEYVHLDTGAMYRSVAYTATQKGLQMDEEDKIVKMIEEEMDLKMNSDGTIICNGEDISNKIRTNEMSMAASNVSKLKGVRTALVAMQQKIASEGGYIVDGRDICEVVLPNAEVKIFLTASAEDRARRRLAQNQEKGISGTYEEILEDIKKRDYQDSHRENSPLRQTEDAVAIDSSNMSIVEVVDEIMKLVAEKQK